MLCFSGGESIVSLLNEIETHNFTVVSLNVPIANEPLSVRVEQGDAGPQNALCELERARTIVRRDLMESPQIEWPLLNSRVGTRVWVKHENHLPTGAFKVRGGLIYFDNLVRTRPEIKTVVAATRGNHGQSVAFAAAKYGLRAMIVVPQENSRSKNAAMTALGAEVVEFGHDFQASRSHAEFLANELNGHLVPSIHPLLISGVGTYSLELFEAIPDLDVLYVPIGMGSGICGAIMARDALGLKTEIVGVVAEQAPAYRLSFDAGIPVATTTAQSFADGLSCRIPDAYAVEMICHGANRIETVSEVEIITAVKFLFTDTHNVAEGAGSASLAAAIKNRSMLVGKKVGIVLSGGNIDLESFSETLGFAR